MFPFLIGAPDVALYQIIDAHTNGIQPGNTASQNATALQTIINANTGNGATIWFSEPVPMDPITLKSNVYLQGNNVAAFKGSTPNGGGSVGGSAKPSGAAFLITNTSTAFCTMQSNTGVSGFVCYYPSQVYTAATVAATTTYPATFLRASGNIEGIKLNRICFVGASKCISFLGTSTASDFVADLDFDLLYAYPMGGTFMELAYVADIARINRCHVNPGVGFQFLGDLNAQSWASPLKMALVADVEINGADAFSLSVADDFMMTQCFAYGSNAAFHFTDSYGRASDCAADTVQVGFWVTGVTANKSVAISNATIIPVGGTTQANRIGILFDGTATMLKIHACHTFTSVASNCALKVSGTGVQRIIIDDYSQTTSGGGAWTTGTSNTNGSSSVTSTVNTY